MLYEMTHNHRPHRLRKTSSMQSKRGDLHHTWLHRDTNDKVIFYFYYPKSVSLLLIISLDLNTGKSKRIPKGGYFCSLPNLVALTLITILYRPYVIYTSGFSSVVVITSASHAEGRRFEPCQKHTFRKNLKQENKCFSFTSTENVTHFRCLFFPPVYSLWKSSLSTNLPPWIWWGRSHTIVQVRL